MPKLSQICFRDIPRLVNIGRMNNHIAISKHNNFVLKTFQNHILNQRKDRSLMVYDFSIVDIQFDRWKKALPNITNFYAFKSCPDLKLVTYMMQKIGMDKASFDCASLNEIKQVIKCTQNNKLFNTREQIIFANPIKLESDIHFAFKNGVSKMTFDCESELHKIKRTYPTAELVIRLLPPGIDHLSRLPLGAKFGCNLEEAKYLLGVAKELNLNVIGTSFHCGSEVIDPVVFEICLKLCKQVWDYAGEHLNLPKFTLLDIGGGFVSKIEELGDYTHQDNTLSFEQCARLIQQNISKLFPNVKNVISEGGRYWSQAFGTSYCMVNGVKSNKDNNENIKYYINDGVYSTYNNVIFDKATLQMIPQRTKYNFKSQNENNNQTHVADVYGSTCDSADIVCHATKISGPLLEVGDWLRVNNSGAYTVAAQTDFNGMKRCVKVYGHSNN